MKKIKRVVVFITIFLITLCLKNSVKAEADLYLNDLEFYVEVNKDSSINITEYWNIDVEQTNTLYKTFKTDNTKYTGITDVKVTDITGGGSEEFIQQNNWEYHVDKGKYYGTKNSNGDFEIGWGTGLENRSATKKYKIEYKVQNAITKYNDYSELYWQLLGKDFEISAKTIRGTIILPENALSTENIKVWGHIDTLNGTIYIADLNRIEFEVDKYNRNHMLEVRVLFPTEMIVSGEKVYNKEILSKVIDEETKWAEEANAKREANKKMITAMVIIPAIILDIVFIISITVSNKNPISKQKKFVPGQKIEYFRDIPRKDSTPGEAIQLLEKNSTNALNYNRLGNVFSAVLLNLKLKGYLEFEIDETKKGKEKISIKMIKRSNAEQLESEEKEIYTFLDQVTLRKDDRKLNIKELQKAMREKPEKIQKLGTDVGKNIQKALVIKGLLDKKQAQEYISTIAIIILQIVFLSFFIIFSLAMIIGLGMITKVISVATIILGVIAIIKKIIILKRLNVFTQKGVNEIEEWKGLKKYMQDFSLLNEREVPDIVIWEKFLVYATAFGIAEKVIKQLKMVYPNFDETMVADHTMMYMMIHTDFNSSFSSAINSSISSAYSSGSGAGGGFSGGGGGGGGRRWWRRTLKYIIIETEIE